MERDETHVRQDTQPLTQTVRIGERVERETTDEAGTVVAADKNRIKVEWDSGGTSYFLRGSKGNIRRSSSVAAPVRSPKKAN